MMSFKSVREFYPFYLPEYANLTCRKLHFIGTCGVIALLILFVFTGNLLILALLSVTGPGLARIEGIFFSRKINRPPSSIPSLVLGGIFVFSGIS